MSCKLDCTKCKKNGKCQTQQDGYYFLDGTCVAEPYDIDANGYIMDETYYRNMANYGLPICPKEL